MQLCGQLSHYLSRYLFECPKFDEIRAQSAHLYESSAGAMRSFVWHKDQQAVCDCMTAVIRLAET